VVLFSLGILLHLRPFGLFGSSTIVLLLIEAHYIGRVSCIVRASAARCVCGRLRNLF